MENNKALPANSTENIPLEKSETCCKNCGRQLHKTNNFCVDCGAKVIDHRITMRYLFSEVYQGFFSIDSSKPFLTFLHLFTKPEEVIGGYIDGVRKKYINAFGYFTIAITLSSIFYFIVLNYLPDSLNAMYALQGENDEVVKMASEFNEKLFKNQSILFFSFVPFLALISWLVFLRNKKFNYAEHLIINLYGYSQFSIVSVLLYFITVWNQALFTIVVYIAFPAQVVYFAYILTRLYRLSVGQIILKTLLFFVILFPLFIVVAIILWAYLILSGTVDLQQMIEAEKARQGISYMASSVINWTS